MHALDYTQCISKPSAKIGDKYQEKWVKVKLQIILVITTGHLICQAKKINKIILLHESR